jgi:opacity protein-like surface antigen
MTRTKLQSLLLLVLLLCPSFARAQDRPADPAADPPWEIEPYVGIAWNSPAGTHLGTTPNRDHLFVGVHITATLLRWRRFAIAYAPELVPLLVVSNNPIYHTVSAQGLLSYRVVDGRKAVAGMGLSPVGFETRVHLGSHLRLYSASAAGIVMFTRSTPVPDARSFNFTFEVGGGGEYRIRRGLWLRVGYKFHHLSNGNSAQENPGVDANVWMIGLARAVGKG